VTVTVITPSLPVVSLTYPVNGGSYVTGSNVTISASASEVNGTIAQVQFYNGSTLLGTSTASPYNYTLNNVLAGSYSLTAVATDTYGISTTSSAVIVTVTAVPPVVAITSPANGSNLIAGSTLSITANASEVNGTITQVQFYNGSTLLGTDTTSPYNFTWNNVPAGSYTLSVKATDANGVSTTSGTLTVTVTAPTPVVAITSPANASSLTAGSNLSITASASETNGTIAQVQFYNGSTLLGTDTTSPYNFTWNNVPAGSYTLTAKAMDANGVSVTSSTVTVAVLTVAPSLPVITISSPTNQTTVLPGSVVPIIVNASENNGIIAQVQIYNGSTLLYTTNSNSIDYTWVENLLPGSYNLTAQAIDSNGVVVTSAPVTVTVTIPGMGGLGGSRF
jgi:hypothetical protein